jgi:hypothetical protein
MTVPATIAALDRRLVALGLLLVAAIAFTLVVVRGGAEERTASAASANSALAASVDALAARITELQESGVGDVASMVARVGAAEAVLPPVDTITVTATAARLAAEAGAVLSVFTPVAAAVTSPDPAAAAAPTALASGPLTASPFTFTVSGSYEAVDAFLQSALGSSQWLSTLESVDFAASAVSGTTVPQTAEALFASGVSAKGTLLVWSLAAPPVVPVGAAASTPAAPAASSPAAASTPAAPASPAPSAVAPSPSASSS